MADVVRNDEDLTIQLNLLMKYLKSVEKLIGVKEVMR